MMPLGSRACLIRRRSSSSTGLLRRRASSRLSTPIPCSALIEPSCAITMSCTTWFSASHFPTGESPGEILRRQAREIIDEIPAAEMPTAIVFLEFLRERGATSLLGGNPVDLTASGKTSDELPLQTGRQDVHEDLDEDVHHEDAHKEGAVAS